MRSRTIREGSVGLLILLGLGLFGALVLWLRGLSLGSRSYRFFVDFPDATGMQVGSPVRYRGVNVGKIRALQPGVKSATVELEISQATLSIPRDSLILANQSGLIGEATVDITPPPTAPIDVDTNPLARDCIDSLIICDGDRIQGQVGVNFTELIRSTIQLTNLFSDPELFANVRSLTKNSSDAAAGVARLTNEVTSLTRAVQQELKILSGSANNTTTAVGQAATQIGLTAAEVRGLLATNRLALSGTLDNVNQTSLQLRSVATRIEALSQEGEFFQNLEILSANAAAASASLRSLTDSFGSQENLLMLQETLDSARATFQNAQKITADLDELTGDPELRESIRELLRGLNNLVSTTQQLEQQTEVVATLTPVAIALESTEATQPHESAPQPEPSPTVQPSSAQSEPAPRFQQQRSARRLGTSPSTNAPSQ